MRTIVPLLPRRSARVDAKNYFPEHAKCGDEAQLARNFNISSLQLSNTKGVRKWADFEGREERFALEYNEITVIQSLVSVLTWAVVEKFKYIMCGLDNALYYHHTIHCDGKYRAA